MNQSFISGASQDKHQFIFINEILVPIYGEPIEIIKGHSKNTGKYAGIEKNTIVVFSGGESVHSSSKIYIMQCNTVGKTSIPCILCPLSIEKIRSFEEKINHNKKITWYVSQPDSKIVGKTQTNGILDLDLVVTDSYKNWRYISIKHLDGNPFNHCISNLQIAEKSTPINKKKLQYEDRALPLGITPDMLHPFVVYYFNVYNPQKNKTRDFFRVEGHPKQNGKRWECSKSNKVSIFEKLEQANKYAEELTKFS